MATTSGSSHHDDAVINMQTVSTFREASSVTVVLLPPRLPDPLKSPPHAEAVDEQERARRGPESKERTAECSVSIPAAREPTPAAARAAAAGDPAYCYPQRDSAWAAALAACIALLIVHELISPLFALQWPFLFSLAFFLLCAVSAFVLSLSPSCFALRRLSSNFTPCAVNVACILSSIILFGCWGVGVSYMFFTYDPAPIAYLIYSAESAVCILLLLLTILPFLTLHQHLDTVTSIIGRAIGLALSFDTNVLTTIALQGVLSIVILTPIMQASSDFISCVSMLRGWQAGYTNPLRLNLLHRHGFHRHLDCAHCSHIHSIDHRNTVWDSVRCC
ncbi:unnamed protein product [Closterium sp. Yama58-4]|nr:unnamed protein product [Closterium sp. Yama58-4]